MVSALPYPKLEINIFIFIPMSSRANIMVMLLRTWKLCENFGRLHYVPLNKKIFDTISVKIRHEAGDLVTFE